MTGILAAMKIEMALLAERLENAERRTVSGTEFLSGTIEGKPVVLAVCGIGKVNAAACAQTMALLYHPDVIINTGVGGALNRTLHVLDVVVGTYAVQHDVDTSALGDEKGFVSTVNRLRFPLSERVSGDLERALIDTGARAVRGAIASGDQFVSEPCEKAAIAERFGASVCEMEGGAIAHVCLLNEIPCCILRAISDGADDGAALTYAEFAERAAHVSAKAVIRYLEAYA